MIKILTESVNSLSQEELKELYDTQMYVWEVNTRAEKEEYINQVYERAKEFALETANENNFFENSIGFWTLKSTPKREPDYTSIYFSNGRVKPSSKYWYTPLGVYRRSNHWGMDVASCSWMIKGRYYPIEGVTKGNIETAFIPWNELYPKGGFSRNFYTKVYGFYGFTFKKLS